MAGAVGLVGCLASLRTPPFGAAGGLYLPFAFSIYSHPGRLIADRADDFFSIHPPGHAILVALGWAVSGPGMVVPHLVNIAAAAVVLWATYRFVTRYADTRAGFCAVAILVAVPVFQAEARNPTPEMLVAALTSLAVLWLAEDRLLGAGLWLAAATVVKETALFVVPVFALWAVWSHFKSRDEQPTARGVMRVVGAVMLPSVAALAVWLVYYEIASDGVISEQGLDAFHDPAGIVLPVGNVVRRGLGRLRQLAWTSALAPALAAAAIAAGPALYRHGRSALSAPWVRPATLAVVPAVSYLGALSLFGVPLARYMVPALAPLVAATVIVLFNFRPAWSVPAAATCAVLGLVLMWSTPSRLAPTDPEGTLAYQHIVGRDQRVVEVVVDAIRDGKAAQATSRIRRDRYSGRSRIVYLAHLERDYLGFVDKPVDFVPLEDARCPYVLITDASRPPGGVLAHVAPRGGPWNERQSRWVSLVQCDATGTAGTTEPGEDGG